MERGSVIDAQLTLKVCEWLLWEEELAFIDFKFWYGYKGTFKDYILGKRDDRNKNDKGIII